jgi:hypothetical protein
MRGDRSGPAAARRPVPLFAPESTPGPRCAGGPLVPPAPALSGRRLPSVVADPAERPCEMRDRDAPAALPGTEEQDPA